MQLFKPNNQTDLQEYSGGEEGCKKDTSRRVRNKVNLMSFAVLYFRAKRLYSFLWSVISLSRVPSFSKCILEEILVWDSQNEYFSWGFNISYQKLGSFPKCLWKHEQVLLRVFQVQVNLLYWLELDVQRMVLAR